jgi:alpha-1,2-mannosyltransferase
VSLDAPARSRQRIAAQTAILVVLTAITVLGHLYYGLRNHFFDLGVYREAMLWWNSGHALYDYSRPDETQGTLGFTYPPAGAFLLRPLAYLGPTAAVVAFVVLAVVCLAATSWWLAGFVARRHGWDRWFVACVLFLFTTGLMPVWFAFDFGQINFLLWAMIVFDLFVLAPRRSRFLGIGIGLATAIKLVPGIFIVYLLISGRRRGTIVAAATATAATLIAGAAAPADSISYWTQRLLNGDGVGQLFYVMNQSLNGAVARLVQPDTPSTWVWLLLALPVLGYGMWRARRAALAGDELVGMTLAGFVGSLISPLTWSHHIFWFAPALLAMIDTAASPSSALANIRSGMRNRWALAVVAAIVLGTVTFDTLGYYEFSMGHPGGWIGIVLGNWMIWLMLLLLAVLPIDPARASVDASAAPDAAGSAKPVPVPTRK